MREQEDCVRCECKACREQRERSEDRFLRSAGALLGVLLLFGAFLFFASP